MNKLPEEKKLLHNLPLGDVIVKAGKRVTALKVNKEYYKVFHYTGWWRVHSDYFEKT